MNDSSKADSSMECSPTANNQSFDQLSQGDLKTLPNDSDSMSCDSGSDAPLPSDSLSSLGEDSGITLLRRVARAFHLTKNDKGAIDQIIHSLDDYPPGYGKVAAIEDLDSDFLIFRKFGWLRNYALLHLQDEISHMQRELERLDEWESTKGDFRKLLSRQRDYAKDESRRKQLLKEVHNKLAQYDQALLRTQQIQSLKRPTERAQRNLYNMVRNTQSLVGEEAEWTAEGPDLAALGRNVEYGWLETFFVDRLSQISQKATLMLFRNKEQRIKTGKADLRLVAANRLEFLARAVHALVATLLLLTPIALLYGLQFTLRAEFRRKVIYQLLIVFVFTLLFSTSCAIFTKARRQEAYAATAAYAAILVIILGNTSNGLTQLHSEGWQE